MPTVLLIRHGHSTANAERRLAGRSPGVTLDETGLLQAGRLRERLAGLHPARVVSSPLERCLQTARLTLDVDPVVEEDLAEVHYGDWTGRPLAELAREPLWQVVQSHPSAARFPGVDGERLADVQARAVRAVRAHDRAVAAESGEEAVWAAFSHGDVIASVLADALGMHLDAFQRIVVEPCSVSIVRYTPLRPFVLGTNDTARDLAALLTAHRRADDRTEGPTADHTSDAVVGGDA